MKTVELFSGIGGFRIACDELKINTVWAIDIEPKAAKVYINKFGEDVFIEGDIANYTDVIPDHELLTAGFPCQPFSSAGKKLGIKDARGTLFEKIVQVLSKKRPQYFVLENVKRLLSMDNGSHFASILDALSGLGYLVEWRLLNSINFGLPQNRERVLIVGHLDCAHKSYLCTQEDFDELTSRKLSVPSNFSRWNKIENHGIKFENWGVALAGKFCHAKIASFSEKQGEVKLKEVLEDKAADEFFFTKDTIERIKKSEEINKFFNGVEILYNQKGGARMGYSIFGTSGVAPTLTCTTSRHYERYKIGNEFRRLTNVEYARIQGFPDAHCESASRYDQYSLYGNAVPPAMVKWVIDRAINNNGVVLEDLSLQMELI